jgi:uncharacterized membrane protein HdeD (DUF308 family)
MPPGQKHQLNIWQPAGLVLLGIGLLTLSTPFFTSLAANALLIDLAAGGALLLAGILGVFMGRKRAAK